MLFIRIANSAKQIDDLAALNKLHGDKRLFLF